MAFNAPVTVEDIKSAAKEAVNEVTAEMRITTAAAKGSSPPWASRRRPTASA